MKPTMTLDRVLSRFGLASRKVSREAILAGRMKVNGRIVRDPDVWISPDHDRFLLDNQRLKPARKRYLLFYKPKGVITSHGDPAGRDTIYKYLGDENKWVAPVGRLDKDTSGLLLLTNDTKFADFIMSPESGIPKTYTGEDQLHTQRRSHCPIERRRGNEARRFGTSPQRAAARRSRQAHLVGCRSDGGQKPRSPAHGGSRGVRSFEACSHAHWAADPGGLAGGKVERTYRRGSGRLAECSKQKPESGKHKAALGFHAIVKDILNRWA